VVAAVAEVELHQRVAAVVPSQGRQAALRLAGWRLHPQKRSPRQDEVASATWPQLPLLFRRVLWLAWLRAAPLLA